jgi:gliding motility-associated protein GldE
LDPEPLSFLDSLINLPWSLIFKTIFFFFLLFCSALVSGAEVAYFSLTELEVSEFEEEENPKKQTVFKLMQQPQRLLATILVTNNFVNILIVLVFASLGEFYFASIQNGVDLMGIHIGFRFLLEVVFVTFLILLFGEVIPKVYATRNALNFSIKISSVLCFLERLTYPLVKPMLSMTTIVESRLGSKNHDLSVETLSKALELTSDDATTDKEQQILEGIVSFGNTETVEVMKPRIDIFAIDENWPFDKVLDLIVKNGYSRNPVYSESIDKVIGVLYAKDLLPHLNKKQFNWKKLMREALFVPENKKLDDLLIDFQEKKNHLAIVVDEYGGTSGLVTMEDVIEEIVGDISDEFDEDDLVYSKLDSRTYVFEGKTTLKDLLRVIEYDRDLFDQAKGEAETIAGLILEILGRFPKPGDIVKFEGFVFKVESMNRNRINQVKIELPEQT